MLAIKEHPKSNELYLDAGDVLFVFDGTPIERKDHVDKWETVGYAPSLCAWQTEPEAYGPSNLLAHIVPNDRDQGVFLAGGRIQFVRWWCGQRDAHLGVHQHLYGSLDAVRTLAIHLGGAAW